MGRKVAPPSAQKPKLVVEAQPAAIKHHSCSFCDNKAPETRTIMQRIQDFVNGWAK